jgi:hypothetical protein
MGAIPTPVGEQHRHAGRSTVIEAVVLCEILPWFQREHIREWSEGGDGLRCPILRWCILDLAIDIWAGEGIGRGGGISAGRESDLFGRVDPGTRADQPGVELPADFLLDSGVQNKRVCDDGDNRKDRKRDEDTFLHGGIITSVNLNWTEYIRLRIFFTGFLHI